MRTQEEELNSKRQELEGLRQEEQQLELQQNKNRDQLNELTRKLQDTQLEICQAKAKITNLQEQQRQMSDAIALYDSALAAGDVNLVPDTSLQFIPEIEDIAYVSRFVSINFISIINLFSLLMIIYIIVYGIFDMRKSRYETTNSNEMKDKNLDAFSDAAKPNTLDDFGEQDPFATSKAKETFSTPTSDPFGSAFSTSNVSVSFALFFFFLQYFNNIYFYLEFCFIL